MQPIIRLRLCWNLKPIRVLAQGLVVTSRNDTGILELSPIIRSNWPHFEEYRKLKIRLKKRRTLYFRYRILNINRSISNARPLWLNNQYHVQILSCIFAETQFNYPCWIIKYKRVKCWSLFSGFIPFGAHKYEIILDFVGWNCFPKWFAQFFA